MAVGSSIRFAATDNSDLKFIKTGSQMVQSSYNSMLPPYIHLGIGESNDVLTSLTAGMSLLGKFQVMTKTPIIPESQLMVFADKSPSAQDWEMAMFTDSNDFIFAMMAVVVIILIILSIWVFVLHKNERRSETKIDSVFF